VAVFALRPHTLSPRPVSYLEKFKHLVRQAVPRGVAAYLSELDHGAQVFEALDAPACFGLGALKVVRQPA